MTGSQIKKLTEKILQFFSDIPTTSHALNKLRLIKQELDEPIVNYNQRYQNLVERVEGRQLDNITSTVAMELYLGSIIEPIRKSIRNALYFNSKHAPKTLGGSNAEKLRICTSNTCMHQERTSKKYT